MYVNQSWKGGDTMNQTESKELVALLDKFPELAAKVKAQATKLEEQAKTKAEVEAAMAAVEAVIKPEVTNALNKQSDTLKTAKVKRIVAVIGDDGKVADVKASSSGGGTGGGGGGGGPKFGKGNMLGTGMDGRTLVETYTPDKLEAYDAGDKNVKWGLATKAAKLHKAE